MVLEHGAATPRARPPATTENRLLKCRDIPERASELLEGDLPWRDRLGMRLHLAVCSMCRAYLDQLRKTRTLLARGSLPPLDRGAEDELIARITGGRDQGAA